MAKASAAVSYARIIKPFPVKRLAEETWYVTAGAKGIVDRVHDLQVNPPTDPERWFFELQQVLGQLQTMRDQIDELVPAIMAMQDDADRAYAVAVDAMLAILRGLQVSGDPPGAVDGLGAAEAAAA